MYLWVKICYYPPFPLYSPLFHAERSTLLNNITEIDSTTFYKCESVVTRILLYDNESFKDEVNFLLANGYNFTIFKILIFTIIYYFFLVSLKPIIAMVPDYCVSVHFHRKKTLSLSSLQPQATVTLNIELFYMICNFFKCDDFTVL